MFRPKAAIFRLSQLQFCSESVTYMSILHSDVEISSSYYLLQVSLSSGMSSGWSMNGAVWISLVGYVLGGGRHYTYITAPHKLPPTPQYIPNQADPHPTIH